MTSPASTRTPLMRMGGPFDVILVFAQRPPGAQGPLQAEEEAVQVTMSWAHLKSMLPVLSHLVASYERDHGVVPAPGFSSEPLGDDAFGGDADPR